MFKNSRARANNKRGFNLIELIVVIAIVGIMVMIAAPKFFGYTNDSRVAAMKTDAKILSGAAAIFHIDNKEWPIGAEVIKGAGLEAVIGDTAVYEIDGDALDPYVKNIKGEYSDYGIITTGEMEGEVVHLLGVPAKDETIWFGTDLNSDSLPVKDEPVDYAVCAAGVYLATDEDFEGDADGEFHYIGTETEIRIPHSIRGIPLTSYNQMFNIYNGATAVVTKVVSDNPNITDMSWMFAFVNDEPLDLSCFDTSGVTDMEGMFSSLEIPSLNLSGFDTSKVETMENMFAYSAIPSVDLSGFDTSNVKYMGWMFLDAAIENLDLSGWDTSNVENMSCMFEGSTISSLDLSGFDTSNVKYMSCMFQGFTTTSLDLSSWDTPNVIDIYSMFESADIQSLRIFEIGQSVTDVDSMFAEFVTETLDLSSWDTSHIEKMRFMFFESKITNLDLSGWDTSNVTDMGVMFSLTAFESLDLNHFDTSNVTNMADMFYNCSVTSLDLSNWDTSSVTNMEGMFFGYAGDTLDLRSFDVSSLIHSAYMFQDSSATIGLAKNFSSEKKFNDSMNKPNTLTFISAVGVATDADFSGNTNGNFHYIGTATEVKIPKVIKGVSVTSYANMFAGTNVSYVVGNEFITDMSGMFANSSATSISLIELDVYNVTTMEGMFANTDATNIDFSGWNTVHLTNISNMFEGYKGSILDLESFNLWQIDSAVDVFEGCLSTVGYARTLSDSNILNSFPSKPAQLTFATEYLATDADFIGTANGEFRYIGTATKVKIPNVIKGVAVTSYEKMFSPYFGCTTAVTKVSSSNTNITNMRDMFYDSQSPILDLNALNTTSVTTMNNMFGLSKAEFIDLSNFVTSRVNNMAQMFYHSNIRELDLRNFNATMLTSKNLMFAGTSTTTGYARTQADATKFNASSGKPAGLTFIVP